MRFLFFLLRRIFCAIIYQIGAEYIMNTFEKIYSIVGQIPRGKVATYGQIAALCGNVRLARVVGYALHSNPRPDEIPCFRVVNREGFLSGSFAFGGGDEQKRLLILDGIEVDDSGRVDLSKYLWDGAVGDNAPENEND